MDCFFVSWCALSLSDQASWVEAIGSIAALFAVIGVAVWTNRQTLKIQTAQARPHIAIELDRLREAPHLRLRVTNGGVGSAIINNVRLFIDGERMWGVSIEPYANALQRLLASGIGQPGTIAAVQSGEWLAPGANLTVLSFTVSDQLRGSVEFQPVGMLRLTAKRIRLIIHYTDIFGNKFTAEGPDIEDPLPDNKG